MEKMRTVYAQNPSLGDAKAVANSLEHTNAKLSELAAERDKYQVGTTIVQPGTKLSSAMIQMVTCHAATRNICYNCNCKEHRITVIAKWHLPVQTLQGSPTECCLASFPGSTLQFFLHSVEKRCASKAGEWSLGTRLGLLTKVEATINPSK